MTQEWTVPAWAVLLVAAALVLAALALIATAVRVRASVRREVAAARASAVALQEQVDRLRQVPATPTGTPDGADFVITRVGESGGPALTAPAPGVGGPLLADLVLREAVVQVASLAHGVRRALGQRDRIRAEARREVRRSRKQRRVDVKAALREYHARQRAALGETLETQRPEGDAA